MILAGTMILVGTVILVGAMQDAGDWELLAQILECLQNPVKEEMYSEVAIRGEGIYYPSV